MTASRIGAEEAERWGLISLSVQPEKLEETVNDLVNRLLKFPPLSLRAIKSVLQQGADASLNAALELERSFGIGTQDLCLVEDDKRLC
jgi:enoyl-CoA hydratase/3-hydroxyacyl-CoA dehydrogenase